MPIVNGVVLLPDEEPALRGARAHIRIEETSRSDAAAKMLGELVIDRISEAQIDARRLPFEIAFEDPGPRAARSIRAHLDLDRDGVVGAGDYITVEHIPLPDSAQATPVTVTVRRIGTRAS